MFDLDEADEVEEQLEPDIIDQEEDEEEDGVASSNPVQQDHELEDFLNQDDEDEDELDPNDFNSCESIEDKTLKALNMLRKFMTPK